MVKKATQAQKLIENMGNLVGVHYSDKTYKNFDKIFQFYRNFRCNHEANFFYLDKINTPGIEELVPKIYDAFLSDEPLSDDLANQITITIVNSDHLNDLLLNTLERVKAFDVVGELYYEIMTKLYLEHAFPRNIDIIESLHISSNAYSYRKVEATMAFGICFWQEIIKYWKTIKEDAPKIEEKHNRPGLLTKNYNLDSFGN